MGRPVMLSNGGLTVGLNEHGLVHDFYFPYVGLENLTTARSVHHKIGVWVDGSFSWVDDGNWSIQVNYESDAMISVVSMENNTLQLKLLLSDFVDYQFDAFCRKVTIENHSDREREVRLFMHQVFQISQAGRADTALYVPKDSYILDYKGKNTLLISGHTDNGQLFDQFAVGNYGIEGKQGTFRDAEDGELSGHLVEHGGVDSVIRFTQIIEPSASSDVEYWIVATDSQYNAEKIHRHIRKDGLQARLEANREYWKAWLATGQEKLSNIPAPYLDLTKKSLLIIKSHIDKRGGIIASCDSSIYNYGRDYYSYVWPRDGSFAIWPLIRLGYTEEPKKFFEFCRDVITHDGYLEHKFQPDRAIGSTWHPLLHGKREELAIQEDETGIVLYMLGEYLQQSGDLPFVESLYENLVAPAAHFLSVYIDAQTSLPHASYDLWEQKFLTSTYSVAVVYQGLLTAADIAEQLRQTDDAKTWRGVAETMLEHMSVFYDTDRGAFRKGFLLSEDASLQFDNTLDVSSFYGAFMFGYVKDAQMLRDGAKTIETVLLNTTASGGAPRYENDDYFREDPQSLGNPWFVTTLWMAQYYLRVGEHQKAVAILDWAQQRALHSGALSEQVHPITGAPTSVAPLVWSHAEYINTVLDLSLTKNQQP